MGRVVLVEPSESVVEMAGKRRHVGRRLSELDQVAMTARGAGRLGKHRPHVEIDHRRGGRFRRLGHGPLDLLADEMLAERRQTVARPCP